MSPRLRSFRKVGYHGTASTSRGDVGYAGPHTLSALARLTRTRMHQLSAKAVHDQSRHQRASSHEQHWQRAYASMQSNRQPATKLSSGADAFAEVVLHAQAAEKQKQALERARTLQSHVVVAGSSGKKVWVPGVAPTTKGVDTRTLQMRTPSEGRAALLHVPPARPAWYGDDALEQRASPTKKAAPVAAGRPPSTNRTRESESESGSKGTKSSRMCVVC